MKKTVIIYGGGAVALAAAKALKEADYNAALFVDEEGIRPESEYADAVYRIDPGNESSIADAVNKAQDENGPIYALFNAELRISRKALRDVTDDSLFASFNDNVIAFLHTSRACARAISANGGGKIVNLSSVHSKVGDGYHLEYAVATAGITALTRELAVSYWKDNIQVNTVVAAFIDGQFEDDLDMDQLRKPDRISLLGRKLTPEDVAKTARFLITCDTHCVNGEEVRADAGYLTTQWRIGDTPFVKVTDKNINL